LQEKLVFVMLEIQNICISLFSGVISSFKSVDKLRCLYELMLLVLA